MAAHQYWRLKFNDGSPQGSINNGLYVNIATLELRATVGGADQCTGGTATASSQYSGQSPSLAFDGNTGTYWESSSAPDAPKFLKYAFASAVSVAQYKIRTGPFSGEHPRHWDLQWSDDNSTWNDAHTIRDEADWTAGEERLYAINTGGGGNRFWRLNVSASDAAGAGIYCSIKAIAMHTSIGGSDICTGGFGDSNCAYDASHLGALAFDQNSSTYWDAISRLVVSPQWARYGFASDTAVVEYAVTDGAQGHPPYSWTFEKSADGANWTVVDTQTAQAFTSGQTRTYAIGGTSTARPSVFICT